MPQNNLKLRNVSLRRLGHTHTHTKKALVAVFSSQEGGVLLREINNEPNTALKPHTHKKQCLDDTGKLLFC